MVKQVLDEMGTIDILVNNAGYVAPIQITVNCVAPGATNTSAFAQAPQEMREAAAKKYPLRE